MNPVPQRFSQATISGYAWTSSLFTVLRLTTDQGVRGFAAGLAFRSLLHRTIPCSGALWRVPLVEGATDLTKGVVAWNPVSRGGLRLSELMLLARRSSLRD